MPGRRYLAGFYLASGWRSYSSGIAGAGGIASSEAFGVPLVTSLASISGAGGIASSEAFGTPALASAVTLAGAGGISSSEAFGVPTMAGGTPAANRGKRGRYPGGFYLGTGWRLLDTGGIAGAGGIASSERFGVPAVTMVIAVAGAGGIASSEHFGVPLVAAQFANVILGRRYLGGFYLGEHAYIKVQGEIFAGGIASSEHFGVPTLAAPSAITAAGAIPSAERFGVPIIGGQTLKILGRRYIGGFYLGGHPTSSIQLVLAGAGGIASSEHFGVPGLFFAVPLTGAGGIPSSERFGVPTLILGLPQAFDPSYRRRAVGLGCGAYEVAILARGGGQRLLTLPATTIRWGVVLDDVSQAQVQVAAPSAQCLADLAGVWPLQHELSLVRNGVEVWVGPIVTLEADSELATIDARDLAYWLQLRDVHQDHTWTSVDLAIVFNDLVADAMSPDNTPRLAAAATPCGVTTTKQLLAADEPSAWSEIQSISSSGIDWTMQRRTLLAGGQAVPSVPFAYLIDSDFATPPKTRRDGTLAGNRWSVNAAGAGVADVTTRGTYGPTDAAYPASVATYGLVEQQASDAHAADQASATAAAKSRFAALSTPPVLLSDGDLSQNATIKAQDLVAGRLFDIRLTNTAFPVHAQLRLGQASCQVTPDGEQITVSFQPVGAG